MRHRIIKVLEIFYEFPGRNFSVRELSKLTGIPRATVYRDLLDLKKQNLVTKDNQAEENLLFKTKKINYFVEKIVLSGLIDDLIGKLNASCIILFGSVRKGDSVKESDIDLFVESSVKKSFDLSKYERKLGHEIQLFVESDIHDLPKHLFNNVVNGIKLFGSFKVK